MIEQELCLYQYVLENKKSYIVNNILFEYNLWFFDLLCAAVRVILFCVEMLCE